VEIFVVYT